MTESMVRQRCEGPVLMPNNPASRNALSPALYAALQPVAQTAAHTK